MKNKFIYLSVFAALFAACEPEFDNDVNANYSAGDADFTTYVAVGNSLTAGYMDGTVYKSGQQYSFPNLLAQQFSLVGGGAFTQPSYEEDVNNLGGIAGLAPTRLVIDASESRPENIAGTSTITLTPQATAYNNMGVPGAKSFHLLLPGYGGLNPYYARHATSASSTVLGDALSKNPTFFTCWIGANDVLAYATTGGIGNNQTGNMDITTYGNNDITDPNVFAFTYNLIINGGTHPMLGTVTGLTANGAKGVVATIPSVTSIPFFTTVPYNPLTSSALGGDAVVNQLNTNLYGPLKQILTALGQGDRINLLSTTEPNPVLIVDEALVNLQPQITAIASTIPQLAPLAPYLGATYGRARQATATDLVLLTTSGVIGTTAAGLPAGVPDDLKKYGVTYPLQDQHLLVPSEQTAIATATASYNASIQAIASASNLAVADMNAIMNQLISGLRIQTGQSYTANYFSGSTTEGQVLFSLDGVHPNARGYAVISNEIIKIINDYYNANLPMHHPSYFPGINILTSN